MGKTLILATRRSPLALAQARLAAARLAEGLGLDCRLLEVVTTGDRQAEWSLEAKGGKGLFTKELETAVLSGQADVAVHSAKDLPGEPAEGLATAGYLPREDPRDVLVLRSGVETPVRIATGSPRRRSQATLLFPRPEFSQIRGNVETRLRKIGENGVADATILAAAGLKRLGIGAWPAVTFHPLEVGRMVPAVGQGAIALQCRPEDETRLAGPLDRATGRSVALERALQAALGGGCLTALGAHAANDTLYLFHEAIGLRTTPIGDADFDAPSAAAARILRRFGLG
ncbi:MAG TPA: hydroxymethylbilane synthase [Opitutaceae bacterium]|jgi:hydroxymethylbilane synthase